MNHYFAVYHRIDSGSDDMFNTCMLSFRRHSDAKITVVTDNVENHDDSITWVRVPSMRNRRALAKVEHLRDFIKDLPDGDVVLCGDVDLYFNGYPFPEFADFAVTGRCHQYYKPINGGVFYLRVSDRIRRFMDWHVKWSTETPSPNGRDWTVGQAFLCHAAARRGAVKAEYGVDVTILGPEWNYCPGVDVFGMTKATAMLKEAFEKGVPILHLKSELKGVIYDGWLDAVTVRGRGNLNWQIAGAL
jgi:hypothetical protein